VWKCGRHPISGRWD